ALWCEVDLCNCLCKSILRYPVQATVVSCAKTSDRQLYCSGVFKPKVQTLDRQTYEQRRRGSPWWIDGYYVRRPGSRTNSRPRRSGKERVILPER
ncbi:hypothetical protein GCK32_019659, partial [Trichostrongylus colubriformis]